jgi:K+/H+ antiporter YhaU regulatory subunit KhtT
MIEITKEELEQKYISEKMGAKDISIYFNVSVSRIRNLIKKYGIRKLVLREDIDMEWLYKRYIVDNESLQQIADELGINRKTLEYHAYKNGFKKAKKVEIKDEDIIRDYVENNIGSTTIARKYGVTTATILRRLWKLGIDLKEHGSLTEPIITAGIANRKNIEDLSASYWASIKYSANDRGLELSVTMQDIWDLFLEQDRKCALSGIEIVLVRTQKEKFENGIEQTASLDRINSSKGYIKGNIQWVHKDLQKMKWNMTEEKFYNWCRMVFNSLKNKYGEN